MLFSENIFFDFKTKKKLNNKLLLQFYTIHMVT